MSGPSVAYEYAEIIDANEIKEMTNTKATLRKTLTILPWWKELLLNTRNVRRKVCDATDTKENLGSNEPLWIVSSMSCSMVWDAYFVRCFGIVFLLKFDPKLFPQHSHSHLFGSVFQPSSPKLCFERSLFAFRPPDGHIPGVFWELAHFGRLRPQADRY